MKPFLYVFLCLAAAGQAAAQGTERDSLRVAREAAFNSQYGVAESILKRMLEVEHGLPPDLEADVALNLAHLLSAVHHDSAGALILEGRAFRADPGIDLTPYNEFGLGFVKLLRRHRDALMASGGLPVGVVHLTGLPPGARLLVDHEPGPPASNDLRLVAGRHVFHLSAPSFHSRDDTVTVIANTDVARPEALDPVILPPAILRIGSRPWATVAIDSDPPVETPVLNVKLPAGPHRFLLSRAGYVGREVQLNLTPGVDTTLAFRLQPDSSAKLVFNHPLRDLVASGESVLQPALTALDIGRPADAIRLAGQSTDTASRTVALRSVVAGVAAYVDNQHRTSDSLFEQALRRDPTLRVGDDDFNRRVAEEFRAVLTRLVIIKRVAVVAGGLVDARPTLMAGVDTVRFLVTVDRPALVTARVLGSRGDTVWQDSALVDSAALLSWNLRARTGPPRPLPSGPYTLQIGGRGSAMTIPTTRRTTLQVTSTFPETVADPGPIPDTALVRETVGKGVRAGSVVKGLVFGGLALGIAAGSTAHWNGPDGSTRAALVVAPAVILGIVGAIVSKPDALDPERVAENARRRAEWEASRAANAQRNAARIAGPYPIVLRLEP